MTKNNNQSQKEEYNWGEVLRPDHLRFVFSSTTTALDIAVKKPVVLGRSYPNALVDADLTPFHAADFGVSRQHATIIPEGQGFVIKDMNSSNGTILNGQQLEAHKTYPLHDGDMVFLGRMAFTIRFVHEGARASRRTPRATADASTNTGTRMLTTPDDRKTSTVEVRGLLKKLDDNHDTSVK